MIPTLLALVALALQPPPAGAALFKEVNALQGVWKVVAAEKDGEAFDAVKGGTLTITNQKFAVKTAGGTELKGDLSLVLDAKPRKIDLAHQEGPLRDKSWQGVYEADGDTLRLCYAEADANKERPTGFAAAKDSGLLSLTLERQKK